MAAKKTTTKTETTKKTTKATTAPKTAAAPKSKPALKEPKKPAAKTEKAKTKPGDYFRLTPPLANARDVLAAADTRPDREKALGHAIGALTDLTPHIETDATLTSMVKAALDQINREWADNNITKGEVKRRISYMYGVIDMLLAAMLA